MLWFDPYRAQQTVSGQQIKICEWREQKLWLSSKEQRVNEEEVCRIQLIPPPSLPPPINTITLTRSLGETITCAVGRNTDSLLYDLCHVCFYTHNNLYWANVGNRPLSRQSQIPVNQTVCVSWVSHEILESWYQDGNTMGLHESMEPHISRKEKRTVRDKRDGLLNVTIFSKIDRATDKVSKLEVWCQWNLKRGIHRVKL